MARGRKSWSKSSGKIRKELLNKLYNSYKKQYNQKSSKGYALKEKLTKQKFSDVYSIYRDEGVNQNVIRTIVTDQREITTKQVSSIFELSKKFGNQYEEFKKLKASDLRNKNEISYRFWDKIKELGGFRKVFYEEDE